MKILINILKFIIMLILVVCILFFGIKNIVLSTIMDKDYVLNKLEETNFYSGTYELVESGFENYIAQSGLEEEVLNNICTEEKIKNDIGIIINNIYNGTNEEIDTTEIANNLNANIDKLDVSQSATLKYSIQLKDSNNSQLLEKTFPVSIQVSITYDDINKKSNTVTSSDSPTLKLSKYEIEENPDPGNTEVGNNEQSVNTEINNNEKPQNTLDNTTAPGTLPQTGLSPILFILITLAIVGTIFIIRRNNYYKDIK